MMSLNRVMLMGNLTRDPVVRNTPSGTSIAEFGLAMNESYKAKDGSRQEKACFVDIVAWDRQAAACGEHLHKGAPIFVEGRLQYDEWTDKTTGDKRQKLKIRADRVHFLGSSGSKREEHAQDQDLDDLPAPPPTERPRPRPAQPPQPVGARNGR